MHKSIRSLIIGASLVAAAFPALADDSHHEDSRNALNIAVFGDSPYGLNDADTAQFLATPAFIKTINNDSDVSLVFNVGDIHSGKQTCSWGYDKAIFDMWDSFESPVIYTPGDNEWTDCHKIKEGGVDPIENLGYVRSIFFAKPGNAIAKDKVVISQAQAYDPAFPSDAEFVENVMWSQEGVVFVTLNVPGGSNNNEDNWYGKDRTAAQTAEVLKRTSADLRWLDKAFAMADQTHARSVVILIQADMWDLDGTQLAALHLANYRQFVDNIAWHSSRFGKPVLLINGDSHGYRSDNPLSKGSSCVMESGSSQVACGDDAYNSHPYGYDVKNFHRITVHGSTAPMEWLKLTVKHGESEGRSRANAFGPFSWQRKIQDLPPKQ